MKKEELKKEIRDFRIAYGAQCDVDAELILDRESGDVETREYVDHAGSWSYMSDADRDLVVIDRVEKNYNWDSLGDTEEEAQEALAEYIDREEADEIERIAAQFCEPEDGEARAEAIKAWICNPANSGNCAECPYNEGFSAWPGHRLPCGQFTCWVDLHTTEEEDPEGDDPEEAAPVKPARKKKASLKKEITAALKAVEPTTVRLNEVSYLYRYQKDGLGLDCDKLTLTFGYIVGVKGGKTYTIEARTYEGILDEIEKYTAEYFADCAAQAAKNLKNGYR